MPSQLLASALARPLALVGPDHPVLRQVAVPVPASDHGTPELAELVARMWRLLDAIPQGIGLAAPQVGVGLAIFLADDGRYRVTACNPRRTGGISLETITASEGCLSVPGYEGVVRRPARLSIVAHDLEGTPVRLDATDTMARIFDHELGHLRGQLYLDRALPGTFGPLPGTTVVAPW